jgi:hypothetical protein
MRFANATKLYRKSGVAQRREFSLSLHKALRDRD